MIASAIVGAIAVATYTWEVGIHPCEDGDRYTSGKRQPAPFNRRFCSWPPRVLMLVTWASLVALAVMLGGWKPALLFMTLPGVWFCAIRPTTVDGPSMAMALGASSLAQSGHLGLACGLSAFAGSVHERAPVFAAMYAWNPWLLVGLAAPAAKGWICRGAKSDHELLGHDLLGALLAHREWNGRNNIELTGMSILIWSLRGLPLMAAWLGVDWRAWAAVGLAFATRIIGTDTTRFMMWAAPALLLRMPDPPLWMVVAHVMTFRRVVL